MFFYRGLFAGNKTLPKHGVSQIPNERNAIHWGWAHRLNNSETLRTLQIHFMQKVIKTELLAKKTSFFRTSIRLRTLDMHDTLGRA